MTLDNQNNVNDDGALQDAQRMAPSSGAPAVPPSPTNDQMQGVPLDNRQSPVAPVTGQDANKPHWLARALDGVLKASGGGDISYTDANGVQQRTTPSRGTLGKTLIAATLAGLLAKDEYVDTPYGPRRDYSATGANAAAAGKGVVEQMRNKPQQLSNEQAQAQVRKLQSLQLNAELHKTMVAGAMQDHAVLKDQIDAAVPFLKDIDEASSNLQQGEAPIALAPHMSMEDAQAALKEKGGYLAGWTAIPDGTESRLNPQTGAVEEHPTYRVVNAQSKIKVSEETANAIALTNPSFDRLHATVGTDVVVPMGLALSGWHELAALHVVQKEADDLLAAGLGTKVELTAAVKKNRQLLPAVNAARDQVASGQAPWRVLDAIRSAKNGADLLDVMGISTQEADDYVVKKHGEEKAAEAAIVAKAQADAAGIKATVEANAKANTPSGQADLQHKQLENRKLQQDLNQTAAQGQGLEVPQGFTPNPNAPSLGSNDLQNDLQKKGVKIPPNFDALYAIGHNAADLKTYSSSPRKGVNVMPQATALSFIRQYINPQYQEGDYAAASGLSKELASTRQGTAGGSLLSAGVASNHLELLVQAADALKNNDIQLLNRLGNTLGVATGKSSAVVFKAISDQVNQEVGKVVAGGQPHEADLANLRENLNSDQSPEQTLNVAKSYIGLMSGRVNEINDRSQQYFGRDVKGISPAVSRVFNKYGFAVGSQVTVVGKNGTPHIFPNQAAADGYKKAAGIQ